MPSIILASVTSQAWNCFHTVDTLIWLELEQTLSFTAIYKDTCTSLSIHEPILCCLFIHSLQQEVMELLPVDRRSRIGRSGFEPASPATNFRDLFDFKLFFNSPWHGGGCVFESRPSHLLFVTLSLSASCRHFCGGILTGLDPIPCWTLQLSVSLQNSVRYPFQSIMVIILDWRTTDVTSWQSRLCGVAIIIVELSIRS